MSNPSEEVELQQVQKQYYRDNGSFVYRHRWEFLLGLLVVLIVIYLVMSVDWRSDSYVLDLNSQNYRSGPARFSYNMDETNIPPELLNIIEVEY